MSDAHYYLSLFFYGFGVLLVASVIFYALFSYKNSWLSFITHKKGILLFGGLTVSISLLYIASRLDALFPKNAQNPIWTIQAISAYVILLLTVTFILKFLFERQSVVATLFYGCSICLVLIIGRALFLNLTNVIELAPGQTQNFMTAHMRFLFFVVVHFFISVALLHVLTKTRFLLFLPDKLLPVSAMFITSLEAAYSLSILL